MICGSSLVESPSMKLRRRAASITVLVCAAWVRAMKAPHWTTYAGLVVTGIVLAWSIAGAWFGLLHRVERLERGETFIHGDLSPFVKE